MSNDNLKSQLIEAYSNENLNELTSSIIGFYKNKQNKALEQICNMVNKHYSFADVNDKKLFSKLVMLYHPDKITQYHDHINACQSDAELQQFTHIIPVLNNLSNFSTVANDLMSPKDFEAEYGWNYQSMESDYFVVREEDETVHGWFDEENDDGFFGQVQPLPEGSFIDAVKRKLYGPIHINFPYHLLEDMEEIEMAEYEIEELTGVEHCTFVTILDLSYNNIFDITKLEHCTYIQELYLSNNNIHYIDCLYHMPDLRVLDLSNNQIEDITVLLNHKGLEFVNLLGNPVSFTQIKQLQANGVVVVS